MSIELALRLTIATAYLVVLFELVALPIPSEASTYTEWKRRRSKPEHPPSDGAKPSPALCSILGYAALLTVFGVPVAFALYPPILAYLPGATELAAFGSRPAAAVSIAAIAFGTVLGLTATLQLRRRRAAGADGLETGGVFAYSRNPIVLSLHLTAAGVLIALPAAPVIIGFPIYLAHMHRRILIEERVLAARRPREFEAYLARVHRYAGRSREGTTACARANRCGGPRS